MYVFAQFQISPENITDLDWNIFAKSGLKCVIFWRSYTKIDTFLRINRLSHLSKPPFIFLFNFIMYRYRYKDKMFLSTLESLLEPLYGSELNAKGLLPLETLHMMVTSHSLFLPTMLTSQNDSSSCSKGRNSFRLFK